MALITASFVIAGDLNADHTGHPTFDTAGFTDSAPGHLRANDVSPRRNLRIVDSGVFWPERVDPLFALVGTIPFSSSNHRLVHVDDTVPPKGDDYDDE